MRETRPISAIPILFLHVPQIIAGSVVLGLFWDEGDRCKVMRIREWLLLNIVRMVCLVAVMLGLQIGRFTETEIRLFEDARRRRMFEAGFENYHPSPRGRESENGNSSPSPERVVDPVIRRGGEGYASIVVNENVTSHDDSIDRLLNHRQSFGFCSFLNWTREEVGLTLAQFKRYLDLVGILWFVVINVWLLFYGTCHKESPHLFNMCVSMVVINYVIVFLPCVVVTVLVLLSCICGPLLHRYLGHRLSHRRRATQVDIDQLEETEYTDAATFYESSYSAGDDEMPTCSICLGEYEVGDKIRLLPCRHSFHKACVDVWLQEHAICPNCRVSVLPSAQQEIQLQTTTRQEQTRDDPPLEPQFNDTVPLTSNFV